MSFDLLMGVDSSWTDICFKMDDMKYLFDGEAKFATSWSGPYAGCVWCPTPAGKFSRERLSIGVNVCCTDFVSVGGADGRWGSKNEHVFRSRFPIQLGLEPDWGRHAREDSDDTYDDDVDDTHDGCGCGSDEPGSDADEYWGGEFDYGKDYFDDSG